MKKEDKIVLKTEQDYRNLMALGVRVDSPHHLLTRLQESGHEVVSLQTEDNECWYEIQERETVAVWFSCGAASAVAAKKTIEKYGQTHNIIVVNNPIINEHHDNERFLVDVEKWLGVEIQKAVNENYPACDIREVFEKRRYISGTGGAPCTSELKKEARYQFELRNKIDYHVLGFTSDEKARSDKFIKFERENLIPVLIDENITKEDCFGILLDAGIKLPEIYKLGFPNANCIGCVKSQSPTYWNLVRDRFPNIFKERVEQSRRIGAKLVKTHAKHLPWLELIDGMYRDKNTLEVVSTINKQGKVVHDVRIYLDELPNGLKTGKIKSWECGVFCNTE